MEIESFDPYHIGIKLNPTLNLPSFRLKILQAMKDVGFNVVAQEQLDPNAKTEIIVTDGDIRIELNYQVFALNTIGIEPKSTAELFQKLINMLKTMGYEIQALAPSFEILTNMNVKTDSDPTKIINKSVNCNLESWKELSSNVNVTGLKVDLIDNEYGKEALTITIGPNPVRPTTTTILGLRYLHIEEEKIVDFSNKIEDRVLRFMKSFGD